MAETDVASPWGPREPAPAPHRGHLPLRLPSRERLSALGWGLASTLLLGAWIGWTMGWLWGVAVVAGVFVHEFGHVLAIDMAGCGPGRIRIVPFFGGMATMERPPKSELTGVVIALAGPVFGLVAAAPFLALASLTGDPRWNVGAFAIAALNLVNLAPAPPLDGSKALGPALARLHPTLERAALIAVGALAAVWTLSRGFLILPLFIGFGVIGALRSPALRAPARRLSWGEWPIALALYAVAFAACAATAAISASEAGIGLQSLSFGNFGGAR